MYGAIELSSYKSPAAAPAGTQWTLLSRSQYTATAEALLEAESSVSGCDCKCRRRVRSRWWWWLGGNAVVVDIVVGG